MSRTSPNADVMFHYVVTRDGNVKWYPTRAAAVAWIGTHKTAHGLYVEAHHRDDARKRAGVAAPAVGVVPARGRVA